MFCQERMSVRYALHPALLARRFETPIEQIVRAQVGLNNALARAAPWRVLSAVGCCAILRSGGAAFWGGHAGAAPDRSKGLPSQNRVIYEAGSRYGR